MNNTLVFAIVWTVFAVVGTVAIWRDPSFGENGGIARSVLTGLPFFGLWFLWRSWRRFQQYRSVRAVETADGTVFIWNGLDGAERQSSTDPREQWDEEDRLGGG